MRTTIAAAALLVFACGAAHADVASELAVQADRWDKAIVARVRTAIEANMAPDLEIDPYTVPDFEVDLYGDVALLSGRSRMTGRYQGKPFASHFRYIDIYVRRDAEWKIVSVQISPMPADTPAPAADP